VVHALSAPVFISYSSKDRQIAQTLCQALEARGQNCWIAGRDVRPGENFQESIVRALREARVMVLVFTSNANNSEEIKKELVLAGRHHVSVVPVRVEDVVPNDAFAYEFATRQWIDLFQDWEQQVEQLAVQIDQILGRAAEMRTAQPPAPPVAKAKPLASVKMVAVALAAILILAGIALAFWRPWQQAAPPASLAAIQAPAQAARVAAVQPPAPTSAPQPADVVNTAAPPAAPPLARSSKVVKKKNTSVATAAPIPAPAPEAVTQPPAPAAQAPAPAAANSDEAAWQTASAAAGRPAYAQYLKDYPAGDHAQEAQLAIANLILNGPATGRNFDGAWQTVWTCPNVGRFPCYSYQFTGQVSGGVYHGNRGIKGEPSSIVLDGKIEFDGAAGFFGEIIVGSSLAGLGAARGTPSDFHALATFENASASGRRIEGRGCTLSFQRQ
jgi:hypothetical protein